MFKNDTMTQYVSDHAPHLAPRVGGRRIPSVFLIPAAIEGRRKGAAHAALPHLPTIACYVAGCTALAVVKVGAMYEGHWNGHTLTACADHRGAATGSPCFRSVSLIVASIA